MGEVTHEERRMRAKDLEPGQLFTVDPLDPESSVRVCLTNNRDHGIRWGFPGSSVYWSWMGAECDVEITGEVREISEHLMIKKLGLIGELVDEKDG